FSLIEDNPHTSTGGGNAIENAHLVVDEVDVVDGRVEGTQRLAQRGVEAVDGSVPVGGRVEGLPVDLDLDRRFREELAALALLEHTRVIDDVEQGGVVRLGAAESQ